MSEVTVFVAVLFAVVLFLLATGIIEIEIDR